MSDQAAKEIGNAICWFGFWLFLGLANFGEAPTDISNAVVKALQCETE